MQKLTRGTKKRLNLRQQQLARLAATADDYQRHSRVVHAIWNSMILGWASDVRAAVLRRDALPYDVVARIESALAGCCDTMWATCGAEAIAVLDWVHCDAVAAIGGPTAKITFPYATKIREREEAIFAEYARQVRARLDPAGIARASAHYKHHGASASEIVRGLMDQLASPAAKGRR